MGLLTTGRPVGRPATTHRLRSTILLIALLAASGAWASDAGIRLGFLLNFSRFTDWPESVLAADTPLRICLLRGDPEMVQEMSMLTRQQVQGRPVVTRLVVRPAEVAGCHVLYLPADAAEPLEPYLRQAEEASTLTVSDQPDFVDNGGAIALVVAGGRYRFDVNLQAAKRAKLRLASQLLKLARVVR